VDGAMMNTECDFLDVIESPHAARIITMITPVRFFRYCTLILSSYIGKEYDIVEPSCR
jgi:hypothetical protein